MTQCERIIDYMERFGSITTFEAFSELGITRLASRIHDLTEDGYQIEREMITRKNRLGDYVSYKKYWLAEDES